MTGITEQTKSVPTYTKVEGDSSALEFDLITFRQRGEESRYLSITFSGLDITKDPPVSQEAYVNLGEEGFKKIKSFFEQLYWDK